MQQPAETTSHDGVAPGGLTQAQSLTIYGPLGIFCVILLGILAVLWRDARSQRKEFLAELERRDKAHADALEKRDRIFTDAQKQRDEQMRETLMVMAKEFSAATVKTVEMWKDNAREQREALSSAMKRIGSRG